MRLTQSEGVIVRRPWGRVRVLKGLASVRKLGEVNVVRRAGFGVHAEDGGEVEPALAGRDVEPALGLTGG